MIFTVIENFVFFSAVFALIAYCAVVTQPVHLGGQTRARTEVADRAITLAEARLDGVLRLRLFEMRRAFYETLLAQSRLVIEQENSKNFDEVLRFSEVRLQEGDVSPGEVLKLRLERIKYDSALANARLALRQAKIRLLELIGETDFSRIDQIELRESFDLRDFNLTCHRNFRPYSDSGKFFFNNCAFSTISLSSIIVSLKKTTGKLHRSFFSV